MLEILRIYFYFMDYYNNFQKKRIKPGVTALILFQDGKIDPTPTYFVSDLLKRKGLTNFIISKIPYNWYEVIPHKTLKKKERKTL